MAPRLKVFVSSDGLHDYIVAASSRPKALAAWGAHQDLFKTGGARETRDPDLVKAALAHPGEVLRRDSDPAGLAAIRRQPKPDKPKGPSPAARRRLTRAQARLDDLEAAHSTALAKIARARRMLDIREAKAEEAYRRARDRAEADLDEARQLLGD